MVEACGRNDRNGIESTCRSKRMSTRFNPVIYRSIALDYVKDSSSSAGSRLVPARENETYKGLTVDCKDVVPLK